jgi:hypothetical protein
LTKVTVPLGIKLVAKTPDPISASMYRSSVEGWIIFSSFKNRLFTLFYTKNKGVVKKYLALSHQNFGQDVIILFCFDLIDNYQKYRYARDHFFPRGSIFG